MYDLKELISLPEPLERIAEIKDGDFSVILMELLSQYYQEFELFMFGRETDLCLFLAIFFFIKLCCPFLRSQRLHLFAEPIEGIMEFASSLLSRNCLHFTLFYKTRLPNYFMAL